MQSYENDESLCMPLSAIKKITLHDEYSQKKTLLTTNTTLSDITVSSFGTIWAVDMLGHLYRSNSRMLSGTNLDESLEIDACGLKWSLQGITQQTPVCVIGENDDLWIATQEGGLIHYDGQDFTTHSGIKQPIRFKQVNDRYFLMGYHRQLMQYVEGQWQKLEFDPSIPTDIPINDLTIVSDRLLVVSNMGLILYEQVDNVLSRLLYKTTIPWFSCDTLQGTVYLAGGISGAYKLSINIEKMPTENDVVLIKEGHFVSVTAFDHRVMFLQALTKSANFVCYIPNKHERWFLVRT